MLLVDKPPGPTSHDVVDAVRRATGSRRVGHAGTLDPFASGLLVVLVGRATRLSRFLVALPKTYTGTVQLGTTTDTDDATGAVTATSDAWRGLTDQAIERAMRQLTGPIEQVPPTYSAKKVDGRRAYRLARGGEAVALRPQRVAVERFVLQAREGAALAFTVEVSGGTYVRALARDLGRALSCGAHLRSLRRTTVGSFRVEEAVPLATVAKRAPALRPSREAVAHLPTLELSAALRTRVVHGEPIDAPSGAQTAVALTAQGELIAVAERDGDLLKPRVVLADA